MPTLTDIVTTQKVALENEKDAMVLAHTQRLAELDADILLCTQLIAGFVAFPQIELAVKAIGNVNLLPVVARDLTL